MKFASLFAAAALASLFSTAAMAAGCEQGDPPKLVDGATATETQMAEAMQAVKAYISATQEFQACLEAAGKSGKMDIEAYNNSMSRMETLAGDFNKQLKTFKTRAKG